MYIFEDNEAVIKMIIKGRSPTMRHVSRTHRVALDWLFDRINLDPKIEIKYIDTKNQLADILTKGNYTRDEWNHLLYMFNISHFSSTVCSEAMAKRVQQDSREERVTAKSRPMMSLIARAPSNLSSSSVSESPGKISYGNQSRSGAKAEKEDRTGQPVVGSDPRTVLGCYHEQFIESSFAARYSEWDDNKAWSPQEWKADKSMDERTGTPVVCSWGKTHESQSSFFHEKTQHDRTEQSVVIPQRGARPQQFVIENDETESELSLGSRSFLSRVNDQVRKRQKRSSMNVTENEEKHSMTWGMFMSVTLESVVFMGKNYLNNCQFIANTKDLTLKQMFDIFAILVSEQEEISGMETICWENHSWKYMSLIGDERVINEDSPQGVWDNIAERMLVEFADSRCPIFHAASPLSRAQLKSKGHGKLSIHFTADYPTIETVFRIIVSANQLSFYGTVAEICEEYESLHERTGRPVVMGQSSSSLVLSVIKTEVLLDCDDRANQDLLLQQ